MSSQERAERYQRMMDETEEYLRDPGHPLTEEDVWAQWAVVEELRIQRDHYLAQMSA